MPSQRIIDMTLDELHHLIESVVDRRFQHHQKSHDKRSMAEVNASIRRNRIVPPANAKSAVEMLREDRDA